MKTVHNVSSQLSRPPVQKVFCTDIVGTGVLAELLESRIDGKVNVF